MNIVHISTDDSGGGAARAAHRLHSGLRRLGHDSTMLVLNRATDDPAVLALRHGRGPLKRLLRTGLRYHLGRSFAPYETSRPEGYEPFADDRSQYRFDLNGYVPSCDIINLHWVTGFVDYVSFLKRYAGKIPIVWTLHDMDAFTGGCRYDDGCGKYTDSCGACPQLGSQQSDDLSRRSWLRRHQAFDRIRIEDLHIVPDSAWLAQEAARSSLLGKFPIFAIHYGLDVETFAPRNRSHARSVLGMPQDASVVMFVSDWVTNRRKGLKTLAEALAEVPVSSNLVLLSIGRGTPELPAAIRHIHFGRVMNDLFLSILYSAADVFVIPSIQEAFGQTAIEAMACGTPVIGSAVGGIREVVRDGVTGYLVPPLDPAALRTAIANLLQSPEKRAEMSSNCRRIAVREYSLEMYAQRYLELYEKMLRTR